MRRLLIVLCLVWIGGVAGLFIGAAVTPEGSGLAGPAIVFVYGVLGAAAGAVAGGLAVWKLSPASMRPLSTAAVGVALLVAAGLGALVVRDRNARAAVVEQEAARARAAFAIAAVVHLRDSGWTFGRISVDGSRDTFEMTDRRKPGHPVCRGRVASVVRLRILDALRRVDALLDEAQDVCARSDDPVMTLRWTLPERSSTERVVDVTAACSASHGELTALAVAIDGLALAADREPPGLACDAPPGGAN